MILKQHHFQTPERPKAEDYIIKETVHGPATIARLTKNGIGTAYNKTAFEKDTAEWESLYGEEEPQPEWISFTDRAPDIGQQCYRLQVDKKVFSYCRHNEHMSPVPNGSTHWADKATFDAIHQRWKDHQVKFHDFKKHIYKSTITEFSREVEDKTIAVCFWADTSETVVSIINDQNEIIFDMSATEIHLEEFEMVLKNRNIKL